jgi:hypothetical protein
MCSSSGLGGRGLRRIVNGGKHRAVFFDKAALGIRRRLRIARPFFVGGAQLPERGVDHALGGCPRLAHDAILYPPPVEMNWALSLGTLAHGASASP